MSHDLETIRDDIAHELRRIEQAARAPYDGRLADENEVASAQAQRRQRLDDLRIREAEAEVQVALEEAAAELRETFDLDFEGARA